MDKTVISWDIHQKPKGSGFGWGWWLDCGGRRSIGNARTYRQAQRLILREMKFIKKMRYYGA